MAESLKPTCIIFGGCGFIGRNLLQYLLTNELVSAVRVVDKVPPMLAWLNSQHQKLYEDPRVEFKSFNLISQDAAEMALKDGHFDYAINCAGETKMGQSEEVYEEGVYTVSVNCATAAAKHGVERYVEISSGQMNSNEKTAHTESDEVKPWSIIAKYKHQVEIKLQSIPGLKFTIVRPAIVYGIGDKTGLTPRLVLGYLYHYLREDLKLLWSPNLKMNTLHVKDLARAIWFLLQREDTVGQVYNVADTGVTTQGSMFEIISDIFNINCEYFGNVFSTVAKADVYQVVEEVNDKHMGPWAEVCREARVEITPLSPYIQPELLDNKHLHLSNNKLKSLGFILVHPTLTKQALQEVVNDYIEMKLFPQPKST